jgi:hypothetical protein
MAIIASVAFDSRSPSIIAGLSKVSYAALYLEPFCLLLPNISSASEFLIENKWYSKFWLVFSTGLEKIMELILLSSFVGLVFKPPKRMLLSFSIDNR